MDSSKNRNTVTTVFDYAKSYFKQNKPPKPGLYIRNTILVLGLFTAYNLFDLNGLTVIFWAIALYVGYGLLLASMRIWQKRKIRKYHKKHKTIPNTYEDL